MKIHFNDRTNELTNSSAGIVFPFASDAENTLQRFNESWRDLIRRIIRWGQAEKAFRSDNSDSTAALGFFFIRLRSVVFA